jgi:hypothetical protein
MKIKIQKLFYFLYFPTLSEQQNKAKEKKKKKKRSWRAL